MASSAPVMMVRMQSMVRLQRVHYRYSILLGLILLLLAFQLASSDDTTARFVSVLLQAAVLVTAVITSRAPQRVAQVTVIVCALIVTASLVALLGRENPTTESARVLSFMLVAFTPPVIAAGVIRQVRTERAITAETMFGVLCIYLLIGMLFSAGFGVAQALSDEGFFASGAGDVSDFLYFSYTTLTTTGYGDLVAGTGLGRSLAIIEALIGQIYLVTIVALIVGNVGGSVRPRDA